VTDVGGLDVLFAWSIFGALLAVLGFLVLRHRPGPVDAIKRAEGDSKGKSG
jgi:hypothetical protein